ncbi:histidine-containing phosphotransfer protein 3-like [Pyrus ussuriensis x Pyrus communis]|uniref:Histidine-containing phosphotransfer protein n=1 Tax=Pyrus ussuriensis x Pyrus communis TaxID=2448454 RepID=A0A5N5FTW3_9ROSA|nr:histidine-containing phosphotransfer protein 3-like [Pyrus ussuriensis x Pyrus communis]
MAKRELALLVHSLEQQGIFEDFFGDMEVLQEKDPRPFEDLFPEFFTAIEKKIEELAPNLSEANANYAMVQHFSQKIKECAETYGCTRLANYSQDLWDTCASRNNKEECPILFENLKTEYYATKELLIRIAKLESEMSEDEQDEDGK